MASPARAPAIPARAALPAFAQKPGTASYAEAMARHEAAAAPAGARVTDLQGGSATAILEMRWPCADFDDTAKVRRATADEALRRLCDEPAAAAHFKGGGTVEFRLADRRGGTAAFGRTTSCDGLDDLE